MPELSQRLLGRGVGLGDVGEELGVLLDAFLVGVEPEYLVAHLDQRGRKRRPEPAQANDHDLSMVLHLRDQPAQHRVNNFLSQ